MDPIASAAISTGGKIAASGARGVLMKLTLRWRIAFAAASVAKSKGVKVRRRSLHEALRRNGLLEACMAHDEESAEARAFLDDITCAGIEGSPCEFLLPLLRTATARHMSASDSQVLVYENAIVPIAEIAATVAGVVDQNKETVEALLEQFPAPLAADAHELEPALGATAWARMLHALANPEGRGDVLSAWFQSRPGWLPESEAVDAWLGLLALTAAEPALGRAWIEQALADGVAPQTYFLAQVLGINRSESEALELVSGHRGDPLIEAILNENTLAIRQASLAVWKPRSAMQREFASSLHAQQLLEARQVDEAVEFATQAFEVDGFTGAAIYGVRALLARSQAGQRQTQTGDLARARHLAVEIRDVRRRTGAATPEAVVLAIQASMLLQDYEAARRLFQQSPKGEATEAEANDNSVREIAVVVLLHMGEMSLAHSLLGDTASPQLRLQYSAREAELAGDFEKAARLWHEAIDATQDWTDKAEICSMLALHGVVHPFVNEMRPLNGRLCEEIDNIAALFQDQPGAEARVASAALDNPRLATALGRYYVQRGRVHDSLRIAEQSARQWGDPDEWLRAARIHLQLGHHEKAIDRAQRAITVGGDAWGAHARALRLQIHATYEIKQWDDLVPLARALLRVEPEAHDALWVLVFAYHHVADDVQALKELKATPAGRVPQDPGQAALWLHLFQRFGTEMAQVSEVLELNRRFSADEHVRRLAVGALMLAPIEHRDVEVKLLDIAEEYHADFPDRPRLLRALTFDSDDPHEILAEIDKATGGRRSQDELDARLQDGTLPVGLNSHLIRRGYTETLVTRRHTARFGGGSDDEDVEFVAIRAAMDAGASLDTTAAFTLAGLSDDIAETLVRIPRRNFGAYAQLRDANDAALAFSKSDEMLFIPSSLDHGPSVMFVPEEETEECRRIVQRIILQLRRTECSDPPVPALPAPELADVLGVWAESIFRAAELGVPLWCDDAATRAIAQVFGVASFGTPALVEYIRANGDLPAGEADAIDAALILGNIVGIRFRESAWKMSAALNVAPKGIGNAILYGGPKSATSKIAIVLSGMERATHDPDALKEWGVVGGKYVSSIAGDDKASAENVSLLVQSIFSQPWVAPHTLQFILMGVRDAADGQWSAAFRAAAVGHWDTLRTVLGSDLAASLIMSKVRLMPDSDRQVVLEVVLRDGQR